VGGCALFAIVSISAAYAFTEIERRDLRDDSHHVTAVRALALRLGVAVRDSESAIDDYLLAQDPVSLADFRAAVADETALAAQIALEAADLPDVKNAVASLTATTAAWRDATGGARDRRGWTWQRIAGRPRDHSRLGSCAFCPGCALGHPHRRR
jgi:hypothetical protein